MNAPVPEPDHESLPDVTCPCCAGIGRVGPTNSVCEACWMRGVVPAWKAAQLMKDEAWWTTRQGGSRRGGTFAAPHCSIRIACDPCDPCPECPLGVLSLAA